MAFKPNPNRKPRLEELSKTALVKTVKTLQRRETKLLNQIAKLEGGQADRLLQNMLPAVEFGYRAGEKGEWNLEMTLHKWKHPRELRSDDSVEKMPQREISKALDEAETFGATNAMPAFPWEAK